MNVIRKMQRYFEPRTFVLSNEAANVLADSCKKAAAANPASPRRLVVVKTSARRTRFTRVAA